MEDCYAIKLTKVDGQPVNLFGVFDGHGGNLAAEYLKDNLFQNLMKQPDFLTDTKLAISNVFYLLFGGVFSSVFLFKCCYSDILIVYGYFAKHRQNIP